jgi:hypothetical protein
MEFGADVQSGKVTGDVPRERIRIKCPNFEHDDLDCHINTTNILYGYNTQSF